MFFAIHDILALRVKNQKFQRFRWYLLLILGFMICYFYNINSFEFNNYDRNQWHKRYLFCLVSLLNLLRRVLSIWWSKKEGSAKWRHSDDLMRLKNKQRHSLRSSETLWVFKRHRTAVEPTFRTAGSRSKDDCLRPTLWLAVWPHWLSTDDCDIIFSLYNWVHSGNVDEQIVII